MNNLIKKHAKSFYWASFFLSKEIFQKSSTLYNFCRTLDDIVDDTKELDIKKENFFKFKKDFFNSKTHNYIDIVCDNLLDTIKKIKKGII